MEVEELIEAAVDLMQATGRFLSVARKAKATGITRPTLVLVCKAIEEGVGMIEGEIGREAE